MSSKSKRRSAFIALAVCSAFTWAGVAAQAEEGQPAQSTDKKNCLQAVFRFQPVYDTHGFSGLRLWPNGETGTRDLVALGFSPGDLFRGSGANKSAEFLVQELESLLLRQEGAFRKIPLVRNGYALELPVPAKTITAIFADCK